MSDQSQIPQQKQKLWANDTWLMDKHPFFDNPDAPGHCERCGLPESNAGHPPLTGEAPEHRPRTPDEQMSEALTAMWRLTDGVRMKPREGWTRQQWVADAAEIMDDIDGSTSSLLNGHVMAMLEELAYMRRQLNNAVPRAAKAAQIVTAVTPVVNAAQHWLMAQLSVWDSPLEGEELRRSDIFRTSVQTILELEQAVRDYNVALMNAKAKEQEKEKVGENV